MSSRVQFRNNSPQTLSNQHFNKLSCPPMPRGHLGPRNLCRFFQTGIWLLNHHLLFWSGSTDCSRTDHNKFSSQRLGNFDHSYVSCTMISIRLPINVIRDYSMLITGTYAILSTYVCCTSRLRRHHIHLVLLELTTSKTSMGLCSSQHRICQWGVPGFSLESRIYLKSDL